MKQICVILLLVVLMLNVITEYVHVCQNTTEIPILVVVLNVYLIQTVPKIRRVLETNALIHVLAHADKMLNVMS